MPDIFFRCPDCDGHLVVDERGAGMHLPCPFCEESIEVPLRSERGAALRVPSPVSAGNGSESGPVHEEPALRSGRAADQRRKGGKEGGRQTVLPPLRVAESEKRIETHPGPALDDAEEAVGEPAEEFESERPWKDIESEDQLKREEMRRLAAMMNADQSLVGPAVTGKRGPIAFRCVACGHVISVSKAMEGREVDCGNCHAVVEVPVQRGDGEETLARGVPAKPRKLPERRSEALRTVDDMRARRNESKESAPKSGEGDLLDEHELGTQFQDLIRKELERLQGTNPKMEDSEGETRRRPPPPLAEHGEVIPTTRAEADSPSRKVAAPGPERRKRILPESRTDAPLPAMVTLDPLDLDEEVAKHWGPSAVVNTKRLNWIAIFVIACVLGIGVAASYWYFSHREGSAEESRPVDAAAAAHSESGAGLASGADAERIEDRLKAVLSAFLEATTVDAKAEYVRHAAAVLPLMRPYYAAQDMEPRSLNEDLFEASPFQVGTTTYYRVEGEYRNLRPYYGEIEQTADGRFLLDWKSWVAYGGMDWDAFLAEGVETPTEFRVVAHRGGLHVGGYSDPQRFLGYTLRSPRGGLMYGYALRDSEAGASLERLFHHIERDGINRARVTVLIRFDPEKDKQKAQVVIDALKAEHWADTHSES